MAYERQYYTNGDVLDARQLNHMETGIKENSDNIGKLSEDIATKASVIKETASGETIVVTDSAEAKPLGLAIDGKSEQNQYSGKNLLDCSGLVEKTVNGVTFTPVYDKNESLEYIEVNGTNNGNSSLFFIKGKSWSEPLPNDFLAGEYIFDCCPSGGSGDTYYSEVVLYKGSNANSSARSLGLSVPFTINNEIDGYVSVIAIKNGYTANKLRFYPMIRLATVTDGTYEPYCGGKPSPSPEYKQEIRNIGVYDQASGKYAVEVKCTKGNLFDKNNKDLISNAYINQSANLLGYTIDNLDHSVLLEVIPNTTYTISIAESSRFRVALTKEKLNESVNSSVSVNGINRDGQKSLTISTGKDDHFLYINLSNDETEFLKIIDTLMINYGSSALPYELYKETTATVYLDEPLRKGDKAYWNGEKMFVERKRAVIESYNGENINTDYLSTTGSLDNGALVEYPLATPITEEIDIDLGELSMFYPTTILSNDCNANMEVEYIADTKAYIDKKFAELATAMV